MDSRFSPDAAWEAELAEIAGNGLFRVMPRMEGMPGRRVVIDGQAALNFSSNNYLGLASHPSVVEASLSYTRRYGAGSTASRLIAGNNEPFGELEDLIARWKRVEAAVVFNSGYQANLGVLTSLVGEGDLVISDELNHASIIDGCKLSKATVKVYRHCDPHGVEDLLRRAGYRRRLVVTESVFSMDGDRAPLRELATLCERHGGILMVDEAHAAGVLGPDGQGLAASLGVTPHVHMGTLGKAVGVCGAYVAGSSALVSLLVNRARSLIYTTALPPAAVGGASAAIRIIVSEEGARLRNALAQNARTFHELMSERLGHSAEAGHIIPFPIGPSDLTMRVSRRCLAKGVFAHGVRYPTVGEGTARLRFTLMSAHTEEDLHTAVSVLAGAMAHERLRAEGKSPEG